ncbi:MAG: transcriptional regulator [Candidatus Bathyarchaeia archaeon]|jgi:hypothetical protein
MEEQSSLVETLAKVVEQLKLVNDKLDLIVKSNTELIQIFETSNESSSHPQADVMTLLKLPASLRRTAMALYKFQRATADDIAKVTGNLRAVESSFANQLVRMGYVKKKREGRTMYFSIEPELEAKK